MLANVKKSESVVGSFESMLEIVTIGEIVKLLRNDLIESYLNNSADGIEDTYTKHKVTLGRKIKVADYETEDFYNEKTIKISNRYSMALQNVIVNIYHLGMVYDLYTMLNAIGYVTNTSYKEKLESIKKSILSLFNSVRNVDNKALEEFYNKYKDYVAKITNMTV